MAGPASAATWLYVPASRLPELLPKAVGGADAVVIDLEDAVHPTQRPEARQVLAATLTERQTVPVAVRVNRVGTAGGEGGTLAYSGDSRIVDPAGQLLASASQTESMLLADLSAEVVADTRAHFRFLPDRR